MTDEKSPHDRENRMPKCINHKTDEELVGSFQSLQDESALEELIGRYHSRLIGFCSRFVGNNQAEDMAQQTFCIFLRDSYHPQKGPLKPWLFSVAFNLCRKHLMRANARKKRELNQAEALENRLGSVSPEVQILQKENANTVLSIFLKLPIETRFLLDLNCLQGLTASEISRSLGIAESTIHRRISRAKQKFLKLLNSAGIQSLSIAGALQEVESAGPSIGEISPTQILEGIQSNETSPLLDTSAPKNNVIFLIPITAIAVGTFSFVFLLQQNSSHDASIKKPAVNSPATDSPTKMNVSSEKRPPFSFTWNFNKEEPPKHIEVLEGKWKFTPANSKRLSGCREITTNSFSAALQVPTDNLPLKVSFRLGLAEPQTFKIHLAMVHWERDLGSALFTNLNPPLYTGHRILNSKMEIYITQKTIDRWVTSSLRKTPQRSNFQIVNRHNTARLILHVRGRHLIDDLTIREVQGEEVPASTDFIKALENIPPEKRSGVVELPHLNSKNSNRTAKVTFFDSFDLDLYMK